MKANVLIVSLLAGLISASPIETRQSVGTTSKEYSTGGCKPIIFFFARGTTEIGNMGFSVGPPTGRGLKTAFGADQVAVEGIDYAAGVATNASPGGADTKGVAAMKSLLEDAALKCPTSILVACGYSQGAALTHRAIENLSQAVKDRIAAAVTYDNGQIPNFPKEKTLIICNDSDAVCKGTLIILIGHLDYVRRVPEAVAFMTERIKAMQ